jgi:hypothetical protein
MMRLPGKENIWFNCSLSSIRSDMCEVAWKKCAKNLLPVSHIVGCNEISTEDKMHCHLLSDIC